MLNVEFCSHALDTLEDVVLEAIRQKFDTFALTEHMPRDNMADLYPEEVRSRIFRRGSWKKHLTPEDLHRTFDKYYHKAVQLREKYAPEIHILIGFETEYIRPESIQLVKSLLLRHRFDYCV